MKDKARYWLAERQRKKWLECCEAGTAHAALCEYLATPLVSPSQTFLETEFLVLDFETTGLDPNKDAALSLGYTLVQNGRVKLKQNRHFYFRYEAQIPGTSVAVHQITETQARSGESVADILTHLLRAMTGRVLVAHFSRIEESFINKLVREACALPLKKDGLESRLKGKLPMQMIDTLKLAYRQQSRVSPDVPTHRLRLFNLREDLGLPRYKAHDALVDAVATAELLLVQVSEMSPRRSISVGELLG